MQKRIEIDTQSVELNSSAGWLYIYRNTFGRDILPDIMPLLEGLLSLAVNFFKETESNEISMENLIDFADEDMISNLAVTLSGLETVTVLNVFWAMAKNADASIPEPVKYFGEMECIALDQMIPEMLELIIKSSVSSKNSMSLLTKFRGMKPNVNLSHSTN